MPAYVLYSFISATKAIAAAHTFRDRDSTPCGFGALSSQPNGENLIIVIKLHFSCTDRGQGRVSAGRHSSHAEKIGSPKNGTRVLCTPETEKTCPLPPKPAQVGSGCT